MGAVEIRVPHRTEHELADPRPARREAPRRRHRGPCNPLRVLPNDEGSEVAIATLFRRPGMTDVTFAEDAALVAEPPPSHRLAALVARG
ncbi:hypothetical protein [Clavibacter zhangzhiyongii]|uniref:hypothetical protein n=1 Tax=Clavibacter zhangzhiyongii TaxID=2768071 RepID=UPI0039DFCC70